MLKAGRSIVERVDGAVLDSVRSAGVLKSGDVVVVAVSGGADSLCLLHALHRLPQGHQLSLHVAHLDHMLRGSHSRDDAQFVASHAVQFRLPCIVEERDVVAYAGSHRCSIEEAAREVRYGFLREVARRVCAVAVLTGHTRDDAVETILLHILRGTGVHGLRGIEAVSVCPEARDAVKGQPLALLRPLMRVSRNETRAYCLDLGLMPRDDASNQSTAYLRNRMRLEVLPMLRDINPRVDDALLRLAEAAAEDDDYVASAAHELWTRIATPAHDAVDISLPSFRESSPAMQSRLVLETMAHLNGSVRDVTAEHIRAVRHIAANGTGRQVHLPCGVVWRRGRTTLTALRHGAAADASVALAPVDAVALPVPGVVELCVGRITAAVVSREDVHTDSPLVAFCDATCMAGPLSVRRRRPGDRFHPLGMAGAKKLQDFMVDAHIPVYHRDSVPIVCSAEHIVWVAGWRTDDRVKLTDATRRVLRLEFVPRS